MPIVICLDLEYVISLSISYNLRIIIITEISGCDSLTLVASCVLLCYVEGRLVLYSFKHTSLYYLISLCLVLAVG